MKVGITLGFGMEELELAGLSGLGRWKRRHVFLVLLMFGGFVKGTLEVYIRLRQLILSTSLGTFKPRDVIHHLLRDGESTALTHGNSFHVHECHPTVSGPTSPPR